VATWNVSWISNLTEVGGPLGAQAGYKLGNDGTLLCWVGPGNCSSFTNGGGPGSSNPGWGVSSTVPSTAGPANVSINNTFSSSVKILLNYTFNRSLVYRVVVSLFVYTEVWAFGAGHHATSEVWLTAKLVNITIT
jgi:hypothetical protein